MGSPGSTQDGTLDELREFLGRDGGRSEPFFTEEVAEALGWSDRDARHHLEDLAERGEVRSKEGPGSTRVWWRPETDASDDAEPGVEQLRAFVSAVEDYAIFTLDPDGRIVTWNQGAERIKGYAEDDIVGEHFSTFYTDEAVAEGVPERNLEAARSEGRVEDEGWRVREDGSRFWANVTITAIRSDDGTLRGFTKVTRDMTERREYEQQLEDQAERLERQRDDLERELDDIFERIDDAFYALDDEFRFEYVNDRYEAYLGRSASELLGRKPWEVLAVEESDPLFEKYRAAMASQEPTSFERYSEPLGIWVTVRVYPSESGLSVYFRDISERKEREQELQRVRDRMEFALNATDAVVWDWNVETDEASFYPSSESLYGTDVETWADFTEVIHPEDRGTVQERIERALETGEPKHEEVRIIRDGEIRWIEAPGYPVEDEDGSTRVVGVARDITERKSYEHRLRESNERLEQFAYAASHDLQEPLRMVSSYLQLLERRYGDDLDQDGREFLEFAVDGADRMRAMIDGLLEYSRVETQGDPFEPVDLDDVLADVREDLQLQIEESDATVTAGELPVVRGDRDQLRQVFQNLVDNGIEYSGDAPPEIRIDAERDGDDWVCSVSDDGIGIDAEDTERIFEVFQRLHAQDQHAGTGIGLALCQRIVERHDGEIWVESEPGEGSTFYFTLPATNGSDR